MSKDNKFNPPAGYVVTIHEHIGRVHALAHKMEIDPEELAKILEEVGLSLVTDPFDVSADTAKVIAQQKLRTKLEVVADGE